MRETSTKASRTCVPSVGEENSSTLVEEMRRVAKAVGCTKTRPLRRKASESRIEQRILFVANEQTESNGGAPSGENGSNVGGEPDATDVECVEARSDAK